MESYSVLMSVYKKTNLKELIISIESMLNQSVKPDQFVIVWDGPVSNEIYEVAERYDSDNPNMFTFVQLEKNSGLAIALNKGLEVCRNNLVARMDTDDYSFSMRCEKQVKEFQSHPQLVLLGTAIETYVNSPKETAGKSIYYPQDMENIKKMIRRNSAFSHPTVMFRKNVIESVGGYDPDLRRSQDHDLFSRLIYAGYECRNLPEILLRYKADNDNIIRNKNKESIRTRILIQKRMLERNQCNIVDYIVIFLETEIASVVPNQIFKLVYSFLKK